MTLRVKLQQDSSRGCVEGWGWLCPAWPFLPDPGSAEDHGRWAPLTSPSTSEWSSAVLPCSDSLPHLEPGLGLVGRGAGADWCCPLWEVYLWQKRFADFLHKSESANCLISPQLSFIHKYSVLPSVSNITCVIFMELHNYLGKAAV